MIFNYTITGETPAKKNANKVNFKTRKTYKNKHFIYWHCSALAQLMNCKKPIKPINEPVSIHLTFTHGDLRRRDSDNGCSSIMDLLTDANILLDDKWQIVKEISITNLYEKNKPQCEITIQTI